MMTLFLNVVFPSLLPFFILSELMLGLRVVHFIGVLFEPLMRPLFSTPGEGAFVLSMGLADPVITLLMERHACGSYTAAGVPLISTDDVRFPTGPPVLRWLQVLGHLRVVLPRPSA